MKDYFGYKGKRVVITGAASGMAQAAAKMLVDLGAEVYALDIKQVTVPVKQYIKTDLKQKNSIDAAVKQIPGNLYAVFSCAGISAPPFSNLEVTLVNFVGARHLIESLLPKINDRGAIALISSQGGVNWKNRFDTLKPLLATRGFDEARAWLEANEEVNDGYEFSKQCINAYVKTHAKELAKRLIRINCTMPGSTDTGLMGPFREDGVIPKDAPRFDKDTEDMIRGVLATIKPLSGHHATAEEQAEPLVFLNSNMARHISGVDFCVDFAYIASVEAGQTPNIFGINTVNPGNNMTRGGIKDG